MTAGGDHPPPSRTPALVGLLVAGLIVVGGWLLANKLRELGRLQDCAMQGRTNCAPLDMGR